MTRRFRSPGRINLIGEHTDYNDGFVLPMAIDLGIGLAVSERFDGVVTVESAQLGGAAQFELATELRLAGGWPDYAAGALLALREAGIAIPAADIRIESTLPIGAGLSSSAAFLVGIVYALRSLLVPEPDRREVAHLAHRAEELGSGARTGIMDQFIIATAREGYATLLDCRSLAAREIELPTDAAFAVLDSGVRHAVAHSAYNDRRAECERAASLLGVRSLRDAGEPGARAIDALPDPERSRARHVIEENRRVLAAAAAFEAGDLAGVGELMYASHRSLRFLYEVSTPELDALVDLAAKAGVYGARMTGAGFGGCVVALADRRSLDATIHQITTSYRNQVGYELRCWNVEASAGVSET